MDYLFRLVIQSTSSTKTSICYSTPTKILKVHVYEGSSYVSIGGAPFCAKTL